MKILFLSDVSDFKGGAENSLFDLMANPHITPVLVTPSDGEMPDRAHQNDTETATLNYGNVLNVRRPFKIADVFKTLLSALSAAKELKDLARKQGAHSVHSNGLKAHGVACLSRIIGGPKVVAHFRAIPFTRNEKAFWHAVKMIASKMVFVSRPCWHTPKLPRNGRVVFNAIDLGQLPEVNAPKSDDPFVIGFAGRIQFTKGVDTLIEWFEYAYRSGLNIKLLIRGEAAPDEQGYHDKCVRMVADKNLRDVIVFEGRKQGLENIFGGIHVNVVPSVVPDPLPRSVMEASALGLPVIAYPAGGIPHMFEDGVSGFLTKDEGEFLAVLKSLIKDENLHHRIGQAAMQNADKNFGMNRLHEEVTKIYKDL